MSELGRVITLPSAEEIMKRLKGSGGRADEYMVEYLYPRIAKEGGRELVANGVVLMLTFKIYDFMQAGGYPPMLGNLLHMRVLAWIDALIDDKDVAEEAKRVHKEAMDATRKG